MSKTSEKLQMIKMKLEKFKSDVIQMEKKQVEHFDKWENRFNEHLNDEPYYSPYSSYSEIENEFENLQSWWETKSEIVNCWGFDSPMLRNNDLLKIIDELLLDVVMEKETIKN